MEEVRFAALEAFHKLPWGGLEIGGVLFGRRTEDGLEIRAARELPCEHARGPSFVLSERDHQRLPRLLESASREPELRGLVPVGWFRSYTRGGAELSGEDCGIHQRYFAEHWQVILALHPARARPVRARFFARTQTGELAPQQEFDLLPEPRLRTRADFAGADETGSPAAPAPAATPESPPIGSSPAAGEEKLSAAGDVAEDPSTSSFPGVDAFAPAPVASRPRWILLAIAWLVALGSLAFAFRDVWWPGSSEPLQVGLYDLDGQLTIGWERSLGRLKEAQGGSLEIVDGGRKTVLPLSRELLEKGAAAVYARQTGDVVVRLQVQLRGGQTLGGVARFVGQPVSPGAGKDELDRALSALQEQEQRIRALETENARLKQKLSGKGR